jgi:hypothetical protein
MLAGVPVRRRFVKQLAAEVDEPTASKLARAVEHKAVILNLDIDDRERLLQAMEHAPAGLAELRGVLLAEHTRRQRQGL